LDQQIAQITAWLQLLNHGTGVIATLKQYGDRSPFRWELKREDGSEWLGTLWLGDDDIIRFVKFTRSEKLQFVDGKLAQAFGRRDDFPYADAFLIV